MDEITKGSHCPVAIKITGSATFIDGQALVIALGRLTCASYFEDMSQLLHQSHLPDRHGIQPRLDVSDWYSQESVKAGNRREQRGAPIRRGIKSRDEPLP